MDPIFTVIVVILAVLAFFECFVAVSNLAFMFLNSDLGCYVDRRWIILSVAAV